jgi:hypothetical protein
VLERVRGGGGGVVMVRGEIKIKIEGLLDLNSIFWA